MAAFPNTVNASLQVLSHDGEVSEYDITPGTVLAVEDNMVGIENRLGEVIRYEVVDGTAIIAGRHRFPLERLEEGTKVVMLEIDDALKAIIVMREPDEVGEVRPDEIDSVEVNPRRQITERFRTHIAEVLEEARDAQDPEQIAEIVDGLKARILQPQERLVGVNAQNDVA